MSAYEADGTDFTVPVHVLYNKYLFYNAIAAHRPHSESPGEVYI